jgi:glycine reductase complex component B subunit gamma
MRANRIIAGVRIPHPVSNPAVAPDKEIEVRMAIAERALDVLTTSVDGPTVFAVDHAGAH